MMTARAGGCVEEVGRPARSECLCNGGDLVFVERDVTMRMMDYLEIGFGGVGKTAGGADKGPDRSSRPGWFKSRTIGGAWGSARLVSVRNPLLHHDRHHVDQVFSSHSGYW